MIEYVTKSSTFSYFFSGQHWKLKYKFGIGLSGGRGEPQIIDESLNGYIKGQGKRPLSFIETKEGVRCIYNRFNQQLEDWSTTTDALLVGKLSDEERFPALKRVQDEINSILVLRPDPQVLMQPAITGGDLHLGNKGERLAAILDADDGHGLERLSGYLAEGSQPIRRIRTINAEPGKKIIAMEERDEKDPYSAEHISDGTLRLLVILAAVTGVVPSISTLIIEEPENGIHFSRLRRMVELCRECSERDGRQIILTTHSIPLLYHLRREEAMAIIQDPVTNSSRIMPPPDEQEWLKFQEKIQGTRWAIYTVPACGLKNQRRLFAPYRESMMLADTTEGLIRIGFIVEGDTDLEIIPVKKITSGFNDFKRPLSNPPAGLAGSWGTLKSYINALLDKGVDGIIVVVDNDGEAPSLYKRWGQLVRNLPYANSPFPFQIIDANSHFEAYQTNSKDLTPFVNYLSIKRVDGCVPVIIGVAVEMLEAWLLANPVVFENILFEPFTETDLSTCKAPELVRNPKHEIVAKHIGQDSLSKVQAANIARHPEFTPQPI